MKCSECLSKPDDIRCSEDCRQMLINQTIAARDKWWIDKIDAMFIITLSSGEKIRQPHIVITHTEWQAFKREVGQ